MCWPCRNMSLDCCFWRAGDFLGCHLRVGSLLSNASTFPLDGASSEWHLALNTFPTVPVQGRKDFLFSSCSLSQNPHLQQLQTCSSSLPWKNEHFKYPLAWFDLSHCTPGAVTIVQLECYPALEFPVPNKSSLPLNLVSFVFSGHG